ncbi:MAG: glycosyltransferase family 2 protein [Alphaproteobacteria bacterium]|nr:glycosyltransferase family 2 protein [Alphaproteobacteria bacterium]
MPKDSSKPVTAPAKLISIVVPMHDESEALEPFRAAFDRLASSLPAYRFEFICVDDGSRDDTLNKLLTIAEADPRYHVLELSRNFGKEAALTAGIEAAGGDAVIPIDADLQDPPELIPLMLEHWEKGAEVVLAQRSDRQNDGLMKRASANWFYDFYNKLAPTKLPKNVGDFRLMDRAVVDALNSLPERQRFMKGLFAWVGFRTVTIDYVRQPRTAGASKFSGWRLWNFALEGITSFSTVPLRFWSYFGAVLALVTLVYAGFVVTKTLIFGSEIPGYASLIVFILFFGSVQLISVGILGEYIGRIYMEVKGRPLYLVRRRHGERSAPEETGEKTGEKRDGG